MVLWFSVARSLYRSRIDTAVAQMALVSVLAIALVRSLILPNLANMESYKEFMQSAKAAAAGGQSLFLFPRDVDPSSIIFYGEGRAEILPDDIAVTQSKDYIIVEEDAWKSYAADFADVPILERSRGRGPDHDARLVLVRGQGS
jgi:hypothetical protein